MIVRTHSFELLWIVALTFQAVSAGALRMPRRSRWLGLVMVASSLILSTAVLALRWESTGHPPLFGAFENTLLASWSVALVVFVAALTAPERLHDALLRTLAPLPPLILAAGVLLDSTSAVMGANERTLVGYVHGTIGWLGFALLLVATVVAGRVVRSRHDADGRFWDGYLFRLLCVGFIGLTATMATGSLYSFILYSDWYRWQIVETLTAATWLAYALVLHSRLFFGWKDRRLAWATIAIGPLLLAAYWIWAVFPGTYHYFGRLLGA